MSRASYEFLIMSDTLNQNEIKILINKCVRTFYDNRITVISSAYLGVYRLLLLTRRKDYFHEHSYATI